MASTRVLVPGKGHPHGMARLAERFDVIHVPDFDPAHISPEAAGCTAIATFMHRVDAATMDALPDLAIVSSFGVGYDHVDARHAASRGIWVTHTPSVLDDEVADTTIGLLINTIRDLPRAERHLRDGRWKSEGNFPLTPLTLRARTVGIVGLGRIGRAIARRLEGFGVAIHYHNRRPVNGVPYKYHPSAIAMAEAVDTIVAIVPSTPETRGMFDATFFAALGSNGVFINVGRGDAVNEAELATALENGTIAAAGLDVFADEPNVPEALLSAPNTVLLPHVASASVHTRNAMADLVVDNIIAWMDKGTPLTVVPECQGMVRETGH